MGGAADAWAFEGVHLVWFDAASGAHVFLCGEQDLTPEVVHEFGIELVVNVNHETRPEHTWAMREVAEHRWYPFLDAAPHEQLPGFQENAGNAVADVVEAVRAGKRVAVHCRAGIHRSPAVVYAALVALGHFPDRFAAYRSVVRVRPYARLYKTLVKWVEHAGARELARRGKRGAEHGVADERAAEGVAERGASDGRVG